MDLDLETMVLENHTMMKEQTLSVEVAQPMMTNEDGTKTFRFLVTIKDEGMDERILKKFVIVRHPVEMEAQEYAIQQVICAFTGTHVPAIERVVNKKVEDARESAKKSAPKKKVTAKKAIKKVTKKVAPVVINYDRTNSTHTKELLGFLNSNYPNWSETPDNKTKVSTFSKGTAKELPFYTDKGLLHPEFTTALSSVITQ